MENIFFQSLIDVDLWNAAMWRGVGFLHDDSGAQPPGIGLIFENVDLGKRIFAGWLDRIGKDDAYEEIRVSIIKGEILGLPPGYSVQISSHPAHTAHRAEIEGRGLEINKAIILTRMQRMTPDPRSPHLAQFEKDYAAHKAYFLVPISLSGDLDLGLSIRKCEILIRDASQITASDLDSAVFPANYFEHDGINQ